MKFCRIFKVNFITGTASSLLWLSTASFPRDMSWERGWTDARASMKTREREREERSLSSSPLGSFAVSKSSPAKLRFEWLNRNWLLLSVTYLKTKQTSHTTIAIVAFYQACKGYLIELDTEKNEVFWLFFFPLPSNPQGNRFRLHDLTSLLAVRLFSKNPSSSLLAQLQTTTLCYNKGLGPDEKSQPSHIFSSRAYGLVYRGSRLRRLPLACLGFSCSNFAKKNKRLLAVHDLTWKLTPKKNCISSRIEKACNLRLNSLITKLKYCAEGLLACEQAHLCEFGENFGCAHVNMNMPQAKDVRGISILLKNFGDFWQSEV